MEKKKMFRKRKAVKSLCWLQCLLVVFCCLMGCDTISTDSAETTAGTTLTPVVTTMPPADATGTSETTASPVVTTEPPVEPTPPFSTESKKPEQGNETITPTSQTVYKTPTGKKYHLDPACGGKNSTPTTKDQAILIGLEPCKKCAQ